MVAQPDSRVLYTADDCVLEAQYAPARSGARARAALVLCHPHPRYGGTMRSIVVSALFEAMPDRGYDCLRFNFRGVERSTGEHTGGAAEVLDVVAAIDEVATSVPNLPVVLVGWSFGGDMALSVPDPRVSAWVAIAAPLRFGDAFGAVADDDRPKHLVLAEHDEIRHPDEIRAVVASWHRTTIDVVTGASHFFVGRTDRVVEIADAFAGSVAR